MYRLRPKSIIWFERLFVASIILSAIRAGLNRMASFSTGDISVQGWTTFVIGQMAATIIAFSIDVGLWYFVAWRASNVAKWLLIIKTSLAFIAIAWALPSLIKNNIEAVVASSLFIQSIVALSIIFLFRQEARIWFREKGIMPENTMELAERFR